MWLIAAALAGAAGVLLLGGLLLLLLWRPLTNRMVDTMTRRLLSEPYSANLWELAAGFGHNPVLPTMENELRAHAGKLIQRPVGTARRFKHLTGIMFNPAQLQRRPLPPDAPVETHVKLGPRAERPLILSIPLLTGAMGYGIGISARTSLALAKGTALAGTACNAGEGLLLPEVREAARSLVLQYSGAYWTQHPDVLRMADMIEIRLGQGAWGGIGSVIANDQMKPDFREKIGLTGDQGVTLPSGVEQLHDPVGFRRLVRELRDLTGGVPIGVKLAASHDLEASIDKLLAAGVDVIAIDGAQGGTHAAPPILADDFGLPTLHALVRAEHHLQQRGARGDVSLLIGGGLQTPGDCLKCLALGADAVYLGSMAMFALTHQQVAKSVPWEPPTQLVYDMGSLADQFDPEQGAQSLANFLKASAEEMALGARALGRGALREVNREDLFAVDPETAAITGLPLAYPQS